MHQPRIKTNVNICFAFIHVIIVILPHKSVVYFSIKVINPKILMTLETIMS